MAEILHQYRFVAVIALLGAAAVLATPKGRLPLALRGLRKTLRRDAGLPERPERREDAPVSAVRRFAAFALILLAFLVAAAL